MSELLPMLAEGRDVETDIIDASIDAAGWNWSKFNGRLAALVKRKQAITDLEDCRKLDEELRRNSVALSAEFDRVEKLRAKLNAELEPGWRMKPRNSASCASSTGNSAVSESRRTNSVSAFLANDRAAQRESRCLAFTQTADTREARPGRLHRPRLMNAPPESGRPPAQAADLIHFSRLNAQHVPNTIADRTNVDGSGTAALNSLPKIPPTTFTPLDVAKE
jgi:hypothetical protein